MELLLPDEDAMKIMAREFEALHVSGLARATAEALSARSSDTYLGDLGENECLDQCAEPAKRENGMCEDKGAAPQKTAQNSTHMRKNAALCNESGACPGSSRGRDEDALEDARGSQEEDEGFLPQGSQSCARSRQKAFALSLLYLYFARGLRYNSSYGTEIYDPQRGLGGLQPVYRPFGALNEM